MSDTTTTKKQRVIPEEQKLKMKEAAKVAREARDEAEKANPELKVKRLAEAKAKREAKKAAEAAKEANNTGVVEEKPPKEKRPSWWSTATEEQKAEAKAKAKAKREAKKQQNTE
jgi:hypothetical protein